jgi:dipeptidase
VKRHSGKFSLGGPILAIGLILAGAIQALACTSVFVGKDASATGHVIIARNEDYRKGWAKHLIVNASRAVTSGDTQTFWSGMKLGYPADMTKTLKYMSVPDWIYSDPEETYIPMDEVGINSAGVAVSATETQSLNSAAKTVISLDGLIEESQIPSVILPRARTALEGVRIFGAAVEKFGAEESGGFAIADKDQVWYLEYSGNRWAAARVPDSRYIIVPNAKVLNNYKPDDTENFLGSDGWVTLVRENNLLSADQTTDAYIKANGLNLAKALGTLDWAGNGVRVWWGHKHFTPSANEAPELAAYPFFMTPDEKITKKAIMTFLKSDNYTGTAYENPLPGVRSVARPIAVRTNIESHIVELGETDTVPGDIGNVLWLALGNVADGVYLPFCQGITKIPASYDLGTDTADVQSAFWAYYGSSVTAQSNDDTYGTTLEQGLKNYWGPFQNAVLSAFDTFQASALKRYRSAGGSTKTAADSLSDSVVQYLNDQVTSFSDKTLAKAWELQESLALAATNGASATFNPTYASGDAPKAEDVPGYPSSSSGGCSAAGLAPLLLMVVLPLAMKLRNRR